MQVNYFTLGKVNDQAINAGFEFATPGTALNEVDHYIGTFIREAGYVPAFLGYHGFPANCCISVNDQVVHGVANDYKLQESDVLTIDCGVQHEDIIVDSADTRVIGTPSISQKRLMDAGEEILAACMAKVKDGVCVYDILRAGYNTSLQNKTYIFPDFGGHTIEPGKLHGSFIPHAIERRKSKADQDADLKRYGSERLRAGQIICLEPVVTEEQTTIILGEDGWTTRTANGKLAVHFEHCMLITKDGYEVIC